MNNTQTKNDIVEDLQPSLKDNINIKDLLDIIEGSITKHTILPRGSSTALALWIVCSYCIDDFRIFPKLLFTSPERRCGKSTALDLLEAFCGKTILTSNMTPSTIYRLIDKHSPTLVIDEADTFIKGKTDDMAGIINSGHSKNKASVIRCVGLDHEPTAFSTWTPMALACIGELESTTMDRCITIQMRRKKPTDTVLPYPVDFKDINKTVREELLKWSLDNSAKIKSNQVIPDDLGNDRYVNNWTPLFTIAKLAGSHWFDKCKRSYESLYVEDDLIESNRLLSDIREAFSGNTQCMSSKELVDRLVDDKDNIWCEYKNGRPLTQNNLASLIKRYGIKPKGIRIGASTPRGYELKQFTDAFVRYLPDPS